MGAWVRGCAGAWVPGCMEFDDTCTRLIILQSADLFGKKDVSINLFVHALGMKNTCTGEENLDLNELCH